jgi:DNA-directed RNA polymerase subunit RPC12/RpoP
MKCIFCKKKFTPTEEDQEICEECIHSVDELTNGKGDEDDE